MVEKPPGLPNYAILTPKFNSMFSLLLHPAQFELPDPLMLLKMRISEEAVRMYFTPARTHPIESPNEN